MKKTLSQLRENLGVPIGQTYDRELMPQITDPKAFIEHLRSQSIPFDTKKIDSNTLKSTQLNFDMNKVQSIIGSKDSNPIFVSKDNHVLDGHHRWLANYYSGKSTIVGGQCNQICGYYPNGGPGYCCEPNYNSIIGGCENCIVTSDCRLLQ